jgi:hypothetical protein
LNNLSLKALAGEISALLEKTDRLVIFDPFESWLDPHANRLFPEHAGQVTGSLCSTPAHADFLAASC